MRSLAFCCPNSASVMYAAVVEVGQLGQFVGGARCDATSRTYGLNCLLLGLA